MLFKSKYLLLLIGLPMVVFLAVNKKHSGDSSPTLVSQTNLKASFQKNQDELNVSVNQGQSNLKLTIPLANAKEETSQEEVSYKNKEMEYRYKTIPNGLKEEIILYKTPADNRFESKMTLVNTTYAKNADNLPIFFDQNGKYLYHFEKPFAQDRLGEKSYALDYKIKPIKTDTSQKEYLLTLTINNAWLTDPKRVFPITVDPTIVYDPKNSKPEIIERRTATSKHFDKGDGSIIGHFWSLPVHYQDDNRQWQDIDTTIMPSTDPNFDFMNITNHTKTYFTADPLGDKDNVKLQKGDAWVTFKTVGSLKINNEEKTKADLTLNVQAEKTENKIKYNGLYQKDNQTINVVYTVLENKLQEEIILNEYQGFPEISQEINLTNAYAQIEDESIAIYRQTTNELLWRLPKPKMYEQDNLENLNYGLHFDLKCNNNETLKTCTSLTLAKVIDEEGKIWLSHPSRQYPVIIDPTIEAPDTSDTYIYGDNATYATARSTGTSMGNPSDAEVIVGQLKNGISGNYRVNRAFLKFDTTNLKRYYIINQVNLKLVCTTDNSTNAEFDVQIVKYNWPIIGNGTYAEAYGGCLAGTADDNIWQNTSAISINTQYSSGNLSTSWPTAEGSTYYCLRSNRDYDATSPDAGGADEYINIASLDHGTAEYHPLLVIDYTDPPVGTKFEGVNLEGVNINE